MEARVDVKLETTVFQTFRCAEEPLFHLWLEATNMCPVELREEVDGTEL